MSFASRERELLSKKFLEVGPGAPTLCTGWSAQDLACHLWVRERDPLSLPGMFAERLAHFTDLRMERARTRLSFDEMVGQIRSGPPLRSLARHLKIDEVLNTMEFFIHHEDLRRAVDPSAGPRDLHEGEEAIWKGAILFSKRLLWRCPVGVVLVRSDRDDCRERVKQGEGSGVSLKGEAGELGLYLFGRRANADVSLAGSPEEVSEFKEFTLRL